MGILDFFRPTPTWTADRVRQFQQQNAPDAWNLVDVRQPQEYQAGHLPGALLIPVRQLEGRLGELDQDKPTVVY